LNQLRAFDIAQLNQQSCFMRANVSDCEFTGFLTEGFGPRRVRVAPAPVFIGKQDDCAALSQRES
jgi:hypothetical protein